MKKIFWLIIAMFFVVIFMSCETVPFKYIKNESWSIRNTQKKNFITLSILGVEVDRVGGWDSIEKETAALAPLYFWNRKCKVVPSDEKPAYAAKINLREREFSPGWNTKRSLVVEVRVWSFEDAPREGVPAYNQKLPVAVGRIVIIGNTSFSSSQTTSRLLSRVIEKTAKQLAAIERQKNKRQKI